MSSILLSIVDYQCDVSLGVYPHEKESLQPLLISLELQLDLKHESIESDDLSSTLDYDKLTTVLRQVVTQKHYKLLETMCLECVHVLQSYPMVLSGRIELKKQRALQHARYVSISQSFTRDH